MLAERTDGGMNRYLRWFAPVVLLGVLANVGFAAAALFAPGWLSGLLRLPSSPDGTVWLRDAALLVFFLSLTYVPAATDPLRYKVNAVVLVLARLVLGVYWLWIVYFANAPRGYLALGFLDLGFGVAQGLLLYLFLREEARHT